MKETESLLILNLLCRSKSIYESLTPLFSQFFPFVFNIKLEHESNEIFLLLNSERAKSELKVSVLKEEFYKIDKKCGKQWSSKSDVVDLLAKITMCTSQHKKQEEEKKQSKKKKKKHKRK